MASSNKPKYTKAYFIGVYFLNIILKRCRNLYSYVSTFIFITQKHKSALVIYFGDIWIDVSAKLAKDPKSY